MSEERFHNVGTYGGGLARAAPFAGLQRIESDPTFRALFFAELDALIIRNAEAAVAELHHAIRPDSEEHAA